MTIQQSIKAVLLGAELVLELAIIEPTRYGPIIHANVPDYAEVLMKIFIDEGGGSSKNKSFHDLIRDIENNPRGIDLVRFQRITQFFKSIREQFRNPLHHTDKVQGYVIAKPVALECILAFDELIWVLFPALTLSDFSSMNYPCYVKFIRMDYDESTGQGNHNLYSKVIQALNKIEIDDNHKCPKDFDAARVISVRRLFHLDEETFSLRVLGYRKALPDRIVDLLANSVRPIGSKRITDLLRTDPVFSGIRRREVEACLQHIQGERFSPRGIVLIQGGAYYLAQ